ncbi:MAG: potassium transporter TrkA [Candidatus Anoxymicrobium japonicum]|uniref:Trk system potassium uptake protein TrkA n=1 Tax=Candidatus Anoxymicrobium japonicum TaxID=2013648 RepID=A0A2N3G6N2_9ACTN|nr:MAG: potassium transporter TrkA [Candidatus Anoxymicrobium japonicum]
MRVLIVGGGTVGFFLAKMLEEKNEIVLIEQSLDRARVLEEKLPGVKIITEDGCEPWVLEMVGVKNAELVLAVTGDDEDNLVISYLSRFEYDVHKVITRVNNPINNWLFTKAWGVDVGISAPDIIAKIVEEETTLGEVVTVMKLQAGDVSLVEITVTGDASALGKRVSELELPPETLIVTVVREGAMMIPTADTVFLKDDKVLAITNINNKDALERLLGHTASTTSVD